MILSWSVFPEQVAMSLLIHNIAKVLGTQSVVIGEKTDFDEEWDSVNYPLYHIDPFPFNFRKGKQFLKWLTFNKSLKRINKIIRKHECKAILCPFPDEYYMNLARKAATHNDINFYPWFHNTYLENRNGIKLKLAERLQPRFFEAAKKVFSISEGLTDYYKRTYPSIDFGTLKHGFNIPVYAYEDYNINNNKPVKFAYTGSLNESCRDAAVRLAEVLTSNPKFELHVFGKKNEKMLQSYGIAREKVKTYGFLEEEDFNKALKSCDIMLLPHGFTGARSDIEYETIFPTRTIPLLYSNRPILLHSPENASLTKVITKNKAAFVITSKNKAEIEMQIHDFLKDKNLQAEIIKNALHFAKEYAIHKIVNQIKREMI